MIKRIIRSKVKEVLESLYPEHKDTFFEVEIPKNEAFGDYSTNVALVLKGKVGKSPREIAQSFSEMLSQEENFSKVEIAGPGFINFWIAEEFYRKNLKDLLKKGDEFFKLDLGRGQKVLVEFVSANPTGPLHIGHGRGAAYGDSIARILSQTGFSVVREYYINDQGTQMHTLGKSVYLRAKELVGEKIEFPEDGYQGAYIYDIAKLALERYPNLLSVSEDEAIALCRDLAVEVILEDIRMDLEKFRAHFDSWYSERSLFERGVVARVLRLLEEKGLIYEKDSALWFRAKDFGDEKDRVLRKSTGDYTYFASDIAYHYEKFFERGFDLCVNLWGADHHGYVPRLKSAMKALGVPEEKLRVILIQMVNLLEGTELKSMSTRRGEFVELKELISEVGTDAVRFIFLSRSSDSSLDFDVELTKKQSQENPVYYVQYAHARICSVFAKAEEKGIKPNFLEANLALLQEKEELKLLKLIDSFDDVLESSALQLAPYKITYYLMDLASAFHDYYTKYRIIQDDTELMQARLALCEGVRRVLKHGLELLGVSAPEKM
ncbi:MAG: arginine--tRNA ligase [Caldimicrobium sp.]|jgi:arginyl-tRNA synthetase|nr:arginine--tRNA ligase [Caldimicrobium sp.]